MEHADADATLQPEDARLLRQDTEAEVEVLVQPHDSWGKYRWGRSRNCLHPTDELNSQASGTITLLEGNYVSSDRSTTQHCARSCARPCWRWGCGRRCAHR